MSLARSPTVPTLGRWLTRKREQPGGLSCYGTHIDLPDAEVVQRSLAGRARRASALGIALAEPDRRPRSVVVDGPRVRLSRRRGLWKGFQFHLRSTLLRLHTALSPSHVRLGVARDRLQRLGLRGRGVEQCATLLCSGPGGVARGVRRTPRARCPFLVSPADPLLPAGDAICADLAVPDPGIRPCDSEPRKVQRVPARCAATDT